MRIMTFFQDQKAVVPLAMACCTGKELLNSYLDKLILKIIYLYYNFELLWFYSSEIL